MLALILDTSQEDCFLALCEGTKVLDSLSIDQKAQISSTLFPLLDAFLKKNHTPLHQLYFLGVGQGPGPSTATRIGAVVSKTLSYALNIPLAAFCSFIPFIPTEIKTGSHFVFALETRLGQIFLLQGRKLFTHFDHLKSHLLSSKDELQSFLDQENPSYFLSFNPSIFQEIQAFPCIKIQATMKRNIFQLASHLSILYKELPKGYASEPLEILYLHQP